MRVQDLPPPTRFMFWCTAPFLVATIVLLPLLARPTEPSGWIVLGAVELLAVFVLLGLYSPDRFWWCWRVVGGIVFAGYLAYLISMVKAGEWFGDGRRSSTTVFNALIGLVVFGYPGFMYAVFGRFTWRAEPEHEHDFGDFSTSEIPMSDVLDQVRDRLKRERTDLRYVEEAGTIVVPASTSNGFDVSISDDLTVGFDGWHEHFDAPEDAVNCFAFAFSGQCRLKVTYRGKCAHKWTLETLVDGEWVEDSTTGLLFFPYWSPPRVEYRYNGCLNGG